MTLYRDGGVPLGGIGCGKVELCPDGAFRHMTCANSPDWPISHLVSDAFRPGGLPEAFLAASVEGAGAVMLKAEDEKGLPGVPIEQIVFDGMYPFARLGFPALGGVELSVEAFSPILLDDPHPQYLNSALPAAVFTVRATNCGGTARRVGLAMSWPQIVGLGGFTHCRIADLRGNDMHLDEGADRTTVRYTHNRPKINRRVEGAYALSLQAQPGVERSAVIDWWYPQLFERFGATQRLPGTKSEPVLTDAGAVYGGSMGGLAGTKMLAAGDTFYQTFILAWHFPHRPCNDAPEKVYRNLYARFLPDVQAVSAYVQDRLDWLRTETLRWQARLAQSNLPAWFVRKLANDICTLSSGTLYTDDGRFSCYESPVIMNGCIGTLDQRAASHAIYTLAFPRLAGAELDLFSRAQITTDHPRRMASHWNLRSGHFDLPLDRAGAIPHDIGRDDFEGGMGNHHHWLTTHWPDLGTVYVLQVYAHAAWTGDREMLRTCYPRMLAALEFQKRLDQDGDGVADLWGHGCCTYDSKRFLHYGATAFIASLHLAALRCAAHVGELLGDTAVLPGLRADFERCRGVYEGELWNESAGQYDKWRDTLHATWNGTSRAHAERSANRHIAQVAGAWFESLLGLQPVVSPERLDRALVGLYRDNVAPMTGCPMNEVGPDPHTPDSWPYYAETYFAANAIWHGRVDEGMEMERRFAVTKEASGRTWDAPLRWEGAGNAVPSWGRWYMSTPASWFVLQALLGVTYDGLTETLTVRPGQWTALEGRLKAAPVFHPLFWATLDADPAGWRLTFDRLRGERAQVTVRRLHTAGPGDLRMNGCAADIEGAGIELRAGDVVEWIRKGVT